MAIYGQGQMLGSGINPESFKQDYSGFANAAAMQAQGIANLGGQIAGSIEKYGEMKKEQKKIDAYNKASAKSIEAAITLGDSYKIKGVRETLSPFLSAVNDPNLSPIEKAALLDEGKAMIPNVFGRFDKSEAARIEQAQIDATKNRGSGATPNLQRGTRKEVINGQVYDIPTIFNPQTGVTTYEDGTVISNPLGAAGQINSALNLSTVGGDVTGATINTTGEDAPSLLPMPPQTDVTGIQSALAMPDGNAGLANVNPMPPGSPTMTTMPRVDGVPPMLSRPEPQAAVTPPPIGRQPSRIPPGAVPVGRKEIRALTPEEVAARGLKGNWQGTFDENKQLTSVTLIPPVEDPIATDRSKAMDAPNIALFQAGQLATQRLPNIQEAYNLLESDAVKTGTLAEYRVAARRLFNQDVSNEEQFMSLVGNLAMEAIDLTKGAISDREMTFFKEQLAPSLNKSVEGNKKILQFTIDKAKRDIQISKKVSELFEKKALPSEIQAEVSKIIDTNPLVTGERASTAAPTNNAPDTGLDDLEAKHPDIPK